MMLHTIRFRQTGGFAGLVRGCELALEALAPKEREECERLLLRSGLMDAAAARPGSQVPGPDRDLARDLIEYEIEIESASGTRRFRFDDLDLTEKVAPLVAFFQKHARPMALDR